jgi:heptosyltransferase-2
MNIAVFVPGWVGDAVMATPALRAIRRGYPDARIIAVGKPYVADVFAGGDWFNEYLCANGGPWSQGVAAVAWQLRRRKVGLAVLFSNSFRSALTAWLGSCRRRIGYARYGRAPLLTMALLPVCDARGRLRPSPVLDAYIQLARAAGCSAEWRMELFTTPADEAAAAGVWEQAGLESYPEVICLNSGSAFGAAKHWPSESFAALARRLAVERGSGVLVLCGPAERALAREIAAAAAHPAVHALADLAGVGPGEGPRLSLGLTKACVRRADLLVTTDSGPRHFAAAFDRPVITLFGPTHIAWTETYYPRAVHLQKKVECGPCQRRVCPLDHRCMKGLDPREVFEAADALLPRSPARR